MEDVFASVDARPKRRQDVPGHTIEAYMRGTMCQISEYELDMLRDEIARLPDLLEAAEKRAEKAEARNAKISDRLTEARAQLHQAKSDAWAHGRIAGSLGATDEDNPYRKDST